LEDAPELDRGSAEGSFMSSASIKGWCPGALRPMMSGDGLVVRVRPHRGRLESRQAAGIADLAARHGNGLVDLTSRANLQIRGVAEQSHMAVLEGLAELDLLDLDPETEARRNILVTPFWSAGDDTCVLADDLAEALFRSGLALPTKFGFAIDDGERRVLADASADIRIERDRSGRLLVRPDGSLRGCLVSREEAVQEAMEMASWFVSSGGSKDGRGRMAPFLARGARPPDGLRGEAEPADADEPARPGRSEQGGLIGLPFGQLTHTGLAGLATSAHALRLTPWRMILAEGVDEMPSGPEFITATDDPRLRVIACSGAPRCREAHADTRATATRLAARLPTGARLHVSGCAKGCAHSGTATLTLVATPKGFDLVREGSTRDAPLRRGLSVEEAVEHTSMLMGAC
jgi:precorrin-3B synthase